MTFDDSTRKRGSWGEGHVFIGRELAEDRPLLAAFIACALNPDAAHQETAARYNLADGPTHAMRRAAFYDWSLAMPLRRNRGRTPPNKDQKTRTALRKTRLQLANWQKRPCARDQLPEARRDSHEDP